MAFYWRSIRRIPSLAVQAVKRVDTTVGLLTIFVWVFIGGTTAGAWWQKLPWQVPAIAFITFLIYGFLRAVYQEHSVVEKERDTLKEEQETDKKRAAIGQGLQRLYNEDFTLRNGLFSSGDETPTSVFDEKLLAWRRNVAEYLQDNVSTGKAQYVDAVPSVSRVYYHGMKSSGATQDEKSLVVAHLDARLKRLAEVMKEY